MTGLIKDYQHRCDPLQVLYERSSVGAPILPACTTSPAVPQGLRAGWKARPHSEWPSPLLHWGALLNAVLKQRHQFCPS